MTQAILSRTLVLLALVMPTAERAALGAQDSKSLRDAVRTVTRGVERGEAQALRQRLGNDVPHGDASTTLETATLERLTFRAADAERTYRSLLTNDSPAVRAHATAGLAALFVQSARYHDAAVWFNSTNRLFATIGDSAGQSEAYIGQSQALLRTSGLAASRAALTRAEALAPRSDNWIRSFLVCNALVLRVRAADVVPVRLFQDARRLAHDVSARAEAACLFAQIEALEGSGDPANALVLLDTLALLQQGAGLTSGLSATRQWQGWIQLTRGNYVKARSALDEAVRLGDSSGTLTSAGWANSALADLAQRVGSWSDGARYARRAEQAFTRARDGPGLVSARVLSASAALATGDLDRAARSFADVQHDVLALIPRTTVEVLAARSDIARRSNDSAAARVLLDSAELVARKLGVQGWRNDLKYRRAMMDVSAGRFSDARATLTTMLNGQPTLSPLLRYQLLARLAELEARDGTLPRALELMERALHEMDRWRATLAGRGLRLAASQTRGFDWDTDLGVATVIATIATQGNSTVALTLADKRRARVLLDESLRRSMLVEGGVPTIQMPDAVVSSSIIPRREVAANTAIVSYTTGNGGEPTTMIVITTARTTAVVTIAADSIADLVRRFVAFLDAGHLARPASRRLAAVLIDPALPLLPPSVKRLIIVPDGSVHRIPFAALLLPDGSLLAQRFEIVTAPSVAIAVHGLRRSLRAADSSGVGPRRGVLAFGAPASAPVANASRGDDWSPLPGARDEMRGIGRLVAGTELIEGELATFTGLRTAALRPGPVLHLATHARALENSLMSGAMLLAPERARQREATAPEIAAMTLPFDLVVLSACESANGSLLTGEGLQGLATAFLEAGSRSVLATRWRLDDRGTRIFLDAFYRSLLDGRDAAGALADARRLAINQQLSPAIWANFELIGDPSVAPRLSAARPWSRNASILAGIAFLCVAIYGARLVVSRRRLWR